MPIYEYDCPKCGRFETIQKMSERPLGRHQACGSRVKRVMSAGAFSFKGSGFYATDYKGRSAGDHKCESAAGDKSGTSGACATCPPSGSKAA